MSNASTHANKPTSTSAASNEKAASTPAASNEKPATAAAQAKPPTSGTPVSAGNGSPTPAPAPASATPTTVPDEGNEKYKIQYHVIVGKVETFSDVSKAEKFLNLPEAPQCTVIFGRTSLVTEWYITTGEIHTFESLVKAQKFLKGPAAPSNFIMVRGRITVPEVRVSLR